MLGETCGEIRTLAGWWWSVGEVAGGKVELSGIVLLRLCIDSGNWRLDVQDMQLKLAKWEIYGSYRCKMSC
jgi:hypothetical protein